MCHCRTFLFVTLLTFSFLAPPVVFESAATPPGTISGQVTVDSGRPLAAARIEAFSCDEHAPVGTTSSDAKGNYLLGPLADGCYLLRFSADAYESTWYGYPPVKDSATRLDVSGEAVEGIDGVLSAAGSAIRGQIKTASGQPLAGAWVTAFMQTEEFNVFSDARTDKNGQYSVNVSPGSYYLIFSASGYITRLHGQSLQQPETVAAPAEAATEGVDATLFPGGEITGQVVGTNGRGIDQIQVVAIAEGQKALPVAAMTNSAGKFTLKGLSSGSYRIGYFDEEKRYQTQWHPNTSNPAKGTLVKVIAPQITTGIRTSLKLAGGISGWVTDDSGNAVAEVMVFAQSADSKQMTMEHAITDETGAYKISGLSSGHYIVSFRDMEDTHLERYYRDGADEQTAQPVEVAAPQITSGINQSLPTGIPLTGRVSNEQDEPLEGIYIVVYPADKANTSSVGYDSTGSDGTYRIPLAAGRYAVKFSGENGYLAQWSGNKASRLEAEPIVVSHKRPARLNAVLSRGGSLSGTVRNPQGEPLASIRVLLTDAATREKGPSAKSTTDGTYRIESVRSGRYHVTASGSKTGYVRYQLPQTISINAPYATQNVDLVMTPGGSVTGQVVDAEGSPLGKVRVEAFVPGTWDEITGTRPDAGGIYKLGGLPQGSYRIRFERSDHIVQWYPAKTNREESVSVEVSGTDTVQGINATLVAGLPLSGLVTDDAGTPLYSAKVAIYGEVDDEPFAEVRTDYQGQFRVPSLAPGDYRVHFSHSGHLPRWHGGDDRNSASAIGVINQNGAPLKASLPYADAEISGKLVTPAGDKIGQAWLTVIDTATGIAVADERICECSGKFNTPVPAGTYKLRVERHGATTWFGGPTKDEATILRVSNDISGLKIVVEH